MTLQSSDTGELYREAAFLEGEGLAGTPGRDKRPPVIKNPHVNVEIDRDKAATLGITADQIEDALDFAYSSRQISTIYASQQQLPGHHGGDAPVPARPGGALDALRALLPWPAGPPERGREDLPVSGPPGHQPHRADPVRDDLLQFEAGRLPQRRRRPGPEAGARHNLPDTITTSFQGTAQAFQDSMKGLGWLLVVAILVIYIVLGILYESFIHPLTILSALPSAGFGALVTLMLFRVDLSIYAFVGMIMLVGMVKKNAIMMIDFALEAERKEGKIPADAIYYGASSASAPS